MMQSEYIFLGIVLFAVVGVILFLLSRKKNTNRQSEDNQPSTGKRKFVKADQTKIDYMTELNREDSKLEADSHKFTEDSDNESSTIVRKDTLKNIF